MIPIAGNFGIPATKVTDRSWTVSTVDAPVEWGRFASLGFGADGRAVISHGSKTRVGHLPTRTHPMHQPDVLGFDNPHRAVALSDHTSMATGSDWLPVWSFHDASNGQLVVGRCTDARCSND